MGNRPLFTTDSFAVQRGAEGVIHQMLSQAVYYQELNALVQSYIMDTRGFIFQFSTPVRVLTTEYHDVFESVSYIACVEWALKQPVVDKPNDPND